MKKLPTSCAVVVFLAALAYQADATIIALTKGTGTPGTLTAMDVSRLTEYDLTSAKNEIPDAVYVRDNNDLILPITSATMPGNLILEDKGLPEYNPMPDVATLFSAEDLFAVNDPDYDLRAGIVTLFFDEDLFAGNQLVDAIYILRDNIIPSAAPDAILNRLKVYSPIWIHTLLTGVSTSFTLQQMASRPLSQRRLLFSVSAACIC